MPAATSDAIERRAAELAASTDRDDAVAQLLTLVDGDREALGAARNRVVRQLHANPSDHGATATLAVLNKALVAVGWKDPYDWKIRWSQPFKRP
jgi:hypothetical protein